MPTAPAPASAGPAFEGVEIELATEAGDPVGPGIVGVAGEKLFDQRSRVAQVGRLVRGDGRDPPVEVRGRWRPHDHEHGQRQDRRGREDAGHLAAPLAGRVAGGGGGEPGVEFGHGREPRAAGRCGPRPGFRLRVLAGRSLRGRPDRRAGRRGGRRRGRPLVARSHGDRRRHVERHAEWVAAGRRRLIVVQRVDGRQDPLCQQSAGRPLSRILGEQPVDEVVELGRDPGGP
jgi:hypothetical protein